MQFTLCALSIFFEPKSQAATHEMYQFWLTQFEPKHMHNFGMHMGAKVSQVKQPLLIKKTQK